ncbi:hypothetical protein BJX96DRAFT_168625 [Aspergillus floccosus]
MSSMFISVCELRKFLRQNVYSFTPGVLRVRFHTHRARSFCVFDPMVLTNGDLDERIAAMLMAAFPRNTSSGSFASCMPSGVRFSELVNAFTSFRASIARRMFLEEGGSRASRSVCSTSPSLQILTRRTRSCKESRSISGVCCSASCDSLVPVIEHGHGRKYQLVMSVLRKHVEADALLHTTGSSPSLLCVGSRNEHLDKS